MWFDTRKENRCFDALAELYRVLDEGDVLVGLWRQDVLPMLHAPASRSRNTVIGSKRKRSSFKACKMLRAVNYPAYLKLKCVTGRRSGFSARNS